MIKRIKIKNKQIFPKGEWVNISYNKYYGKVNDEEIYFYVEDEFNLKNLKVGDEIQLDEKFKIIKI